MSHKLKEILSEQMSLTAEKPKLSEEQPKPLTPAVNDILARYGGASNFMQVFNKDIQQLVAENTERAYTGNAPNLRLTAQTYGYKLLIVWLMAQLENLNDFVGVNQKMSIQQMEEISRIIASDYKSLKVTEIHLFLHRLKAGYYGEFFGCIDPIRITNALRQFSLERVSEIATLERKKQNSELISLREHWRKTSISRAEYEKIKAKKNISQNK